MELIVTTREQLSHIIMDEISRALNFKPQQPQPLDRCGVEEAVQYLEEQGYPTSESKLYKLTAAKRIPFRHFGNRLVFSRKELLAWAESQTIDKNDTSDIDLELARTARKKKGAKNA